MVATEQVLEDEPAPALPRRRRKPAFAVIAGGLLMAALDQTIMATALPTITADLGGAEHISWVITSYLLTQTIATALGGKLGDMFGRKAVFVVSIVIFVASSAAAGLAGSMTWLILMRAVQGIGGGGLTVTSIALIADIIPMRDRGRYQGAIGAVFGVTTVLGPLLGGFFTDHLSWRWVFYINIPVSAVVLLFAVRLLPAAPRSAVRPVVDYLGITLVAGASTALILGTSWGGETYPWGSPVILGLFAAGVLLAVLFVLAEQRASEPVLPMRLFGQGVFRTCSVLSFIVGFTMLGVMTFLPTYLQYCQGVSATESGVRTLPMVVGLFVASTSAGNVVTRTGVYKPFPIVGSVVMGAGLVLLSRLDESSGVLETSVAMLVLGTGIGLSMQILTIVVQNTVPYRDLGVATSGVTFFRTMGGSFGAAVFGTLYTNALGTNLGAALARTGLPQSAVSSPEAVHALPADQQAIVIAAYSDTISTVFAYAVPVTLVALVVALMVPRVPLRGLAKAAATDVGEGFQMPDQRGWEAVLEEQVARIFATRGTLVFPTLLESSSARLDVVQEWIVRQVAVLSLHGRRAVDPVWIARARRMPVGVIRPAIDDAVAAGLLRETGGRLALTEEGETRFAAVVEDVLAWLEEELVAEGTELDDEGRAQLRRIARHLAEEQTGLDPAEVA